MQAFLKHGSTGPLSPRRSPSVDGQFTEFVRQPASPGYAKAFASLTGSTRSPDLRRDPRAISVTCTNSPPRTVATTFTLSSSGSA